MPTQRSICPHCGNALTAQTTPAIPRRDLAAEGRLRREAIYQALKAIPGASLRYLAQEVGLSVSSPASVRHHLQLLERAGRVIQTAGRWRVKE